MEEVQNLPQVPPSVPEKGKGKRSWSGWVIFFITLVVTAAVVGGLVGWWQQMRINKLEGDMSLLEEQTLELTRSLLIPSVSVTPPPELLPTSEVAPTAEPEVSVVPAASGSAEDVLLLRQAFATKYSKPLSEISVTISEQDGNYATGGVSLGEGPGEGGIWWGVKQNGQWIIAADGNGLPYCSELDAYSIPVSLISQCSGADGSLVER